MKKIKNHHYVLIMHILICSIIVAINFSMIRAISIGLTLLYLITVKVISKSKGLDYLVQLSVFTLIPFCYTSKDLIDKYANTDWSSIIVLLYTFSAFIIAIKIPRVRKESILNIRSRYTEGDNEVRNKTNCFVAKVLFASLVPNLLLILYFNWPIKIITSLLFIIVIYILVKLYANYIGRKKIMKLSHDLNK